MVFDFFGYAITQTVFISKKFVFPNYSSDDLKLGYLEVPFVSISPSGQVWDYREAGRQTDLVIYWAAADKAQIS